MNKKLLIIVVVLLTLLLFTSSVYAVEYVDGVPKDSHKIRNKWDLSGTFVSHPGYNWGGLAEGATWNYSIHIKEAMYGEYSRGTVHFMTDGIDVVGNVTATKRFYDYWSGDNLAAVGTAEYNDHVYYFVFLYAERATWIALSDTPFDSYWAVESVWGGGLRAYQTHSKVPDETFTLDYKIIHE
jgi:hypothetical protein